MWGTLRMALQIRDPTEFIRVISTRQAPQYSESEGRRFAWCFRPSPGVCRRLIRPNVICQAVGNHFTRGLPARNGGSGPWRAEGGPEIRVDPVTGRFDGWLLPNPEDWYGLSRNIAIVGPGRFIPDVRTKRRTQSALIERVENLYGGHGAIEVRRLMLEPSAYRFSTSFQ